MTAKEKKEIKQCKKLNKLIVVKLRKEFAQRLELRKEKNIIDTEDLEFQEKYNELMVLSVFMDNYPEVETCDLLMILKKNRCKFLINCYKENINFFEDLREWGVDEMICRIKEINEKGKSF